MATDGDRRRRTDQDDRKDHRTDQDRRTERRDADFAAAVKAIAEQDLELWKSDHDIHALARACDHAAQHAELVATTPTDQPPRVHQLTCLRAQSWAARLARLLAHQQVVRTDALIEMLEAEHELETGAAV